MASPVLPEASGSGDRVISGAVAIIYDTTVGLWSDVWPGAVSSHLANMTGEQSDMPIIHSLEETVPRVEGAGGGAGGPVEVNIVLMGGIMSLSPWVWFSSGSGLIYLMLALIYLSPILFTTYTYVPLLVPSYTKLP